jgi:hypothetical protein
LFTHWVVPALQTPASSVDESVGPEDSASELSRIELSPPLEVPPLLELPLPLELPPLELPPVLEPSPGSVLSPPAPSLGASESATSSGLDASGDGESDEESELSSPPPSPLVLTRSEQAAGPTSHATRMAKRRAWRHRAPRRWREGRITTR